MATLANVTERIQFLIAVNETYSDVKVRRQSQLLANLLLVGVFVIVASAVLNFVSGTSTQMLTSSATMAVVVVAFWLNRMGRYHVAASIFVALTFAIGLILPLINVESPNNTSRIMYIVIGIFFCGTFFDLRVTTRVTVAAIVAVFSYMLVIPELGIETGTVTFILLAGLITLVSMRNQILIENDRRSELEAINTTLSTNNDELRKLTAEQAKSEARWRGILENAPVTVTTCNADGHIQFSNHAAADVATTIFDLYPTAEANMVEHSLERVRTGQTAPPLDFTEATDTGETIFLMAQFGLVEHENETIQVACLVSDMTERVQADEEQKRLQEQVIATQEEQKRLQEQVIATQAETLKELSTPIIPITHDVIVLPLVGTIDSHRARDITRGLLAGIEQHRAAVVILDITGVPVVDTDVAAHLNRAVQAARLKGAQTIVSGISDAVAEAIVDLGIDWSSISTVRDLSAALAIAMQVDSSRLKRVTRSGGVSPIG